MKALAPILIAALFLAPAIRLLLLARRTREMPELLAGLFFLGTGLGVPLRILGHALALEGDRLGPWLTLAGHLSFGGATCALAVFTWRVFRPKATWAKGLATGLLAIQAGIAALLLFIPSASQEASPSMMLINSSRVIPLLWAFLESFAYWRTMQRRLAIGLSDPVVTNRFFLWAIWTGCLASLPLTALALRIASRLLRDFGLIQGQVSAADQAAIAHNAQIVFLITGFAGMIAISLSFFPPRRYLTWIRPQSQPPAIPDPPSVQV
ncbi:MAG: hypothetical protein AB8G23_13365 [Myxococcota bacterium]